MRLQNTPWLAIVATLLLLPNQQSAATDSVPIRARLEAVLHTNARRYLKVGTHTPWQIFHGILAYGGQYTILDRNDRAITAVSYILSRGGLDGTRLFEPTPYGLRVVQTGTTEGHPNQFLAILALSNVPLDAPIVVDKLRYQVHHLLTNAQYEYYTGQEASWSLIAFTTYLPLDSRWRNKYDDVVSIEGIVDYEVRLATEYAPCGGTHNLFALAYALDRFRSQHPETQLTGVWSRADDKLRRYAELTRAYQNADGSFSTLFYNGRGLGDDPETIMYSTGHTLEWLSVYLSDQELRSAWVENAVLRLCQAFEQTATAPLKCGPMYHALHGLKLYYERRFGEVQVVGGNGHTAKRHRLAP